MPLNSAKLPSPWRKKRSIGIIRSIAFSSGRGGAVGGGKGLPRREQVDQQLDQRAGIARDVAAVGKNLPRQFVGEFARGGADASPLVGKAKRGVAERDQHLQPRHAVGKIE